MRIAETIDAFYGDAGTRDGVSRSYKKAVEDLDAETIKALDGPYRYADVIYLRLTLPCSLMTYDFQEMRSRANIPLRSLLHRHKRLYSEAAKQTNRLRRSARKGEETHRKARQGRHETPRFRARSRDGPVGVRNAK
jgi:hypothetical protein